MQRPHPRVRAVNSKSRNHLLLLAVLLLVPAIGCATPTLPPASPARDARALPSGQAPAHTESAREAPASSRPPAVSRTVPEVQVSAPPGPFDLDPRVPLPVAGQRWIDSTLATLTLRQRVGQMMMIWVLGDYTSSQDPGFMSIVEQVKTLGVGGLVMSLGSPIEVAAKVNYLQGLATVPLIVASDVEPGLGRLEGGVFAPSLMSGGSATVLPSNMAIGADGRVQDAEAAGRIVGAEARAIGIQMAFAPVVDVNNNPSNPVINVRSFGEDPRRVAQLSAAFVRGVQAAGVVATPKHFPGHGDTDVDSHLGLPVIPVSRARLDSVELVPFQSAIRAGAAAMMTAHIALPKAYGDKTPATLSQALMHGLLRDTLGFTGVTVTDAMTMNGIVKGYGVEESTLRAVDAGDDIILMPPSVPAAINAIMEAVENGRISSARIDSSVRRILELKIRTGAISRPVVSLAHLRDSVGTPAHVAVANDIASRAITLLRDPGKLIPVSRNSSVMVITYAADGEITAGNAFVDEVRARSTRETVVRLSPRSGTRELDSLVRRARSSSRVIFYSYTRTLEGAGKLAIPRPIALFVSKLASTGKLIFVAGGNPYQLRQLKAVPTYLVTYGRGEALERAAARAVFGASDIVGTSPVTLPGYFKRGDGIVRSSVASSRAPSLREAPHVDEAHRHAALDSLKRVLDIAVSDGAFPGAYAAIGTIDGVIAEYGAGQLDEEDAFTPNARTVWDLASLTKVIGTTTAVMQLVGAGKVDLDSPVARYLPDWTAPGAASITVRHLLTHSGGLPAWRPFYKEATSPNEVVKQLFAVSPDTVPGVRYVYSDIGFMLLGKLVERVSGVALAEYDSARVFAPMGMRDTRYLPPAVWRNRTAPTEQDPWRQRKLRGEVHDENAAAIDGISGHAGLFSTGADLQRFARMYLGGGEIDGVRILPADVIHTFTSVQAPKISPRALGWEKPTATNSSGSRFSSLAFGHTGFTGTSIWIDPGKGVYVILLTNRVNPTRENRKIGAVRIALANAALNALGLP